METLKELEKRYEKLSGEIEDNIDDARINGKYDYTETSEYKSKKRQLSEFYFKIKSLERKKSFGGVF